MENRFFWLKLKIMGGEGKYIGKLLDVGVTHNPNMCLVEIGLSLGTSDGRVLLSI